MVATDKSETEPQLRRADDGDAGAISELVVAAYEHYIPLIGRTPIPMRIDYAAAIHEHEVWVLEREGEIVAVIDLAPEPDHLWIENVAVSPAWQGRGLGRQLLAHAEGECRRHRLPELRLLTNERYVANIAMYQRYGFVETRRRPYLGTDLVYFTKALPGPGEGEG